MTKVPLKNRFVFQVHFAIRFDEGWFKWDSTWNEQALYKHQNAIWWPRLFFAVFGIQFGMALWIGKGEIL